MVPTEALRAELAALGFRGLRVVSRGVDTALFNPARRSEALRASWGAAPADPVLLHVGRLAPEKNLDALLARVRGGAPARRRARGWCWWATARRDASCRRAARRRSSPACGAARTSPRTTPRPTCSCFPSLTETYGNVTAEAMASGLAVVAFDYAAAAALIRHGENGLLARFGDAEAFCALAAGLVADPAAIAALGAQARQAAAAHDWTRVVRQLESVLEVAAAAGPVRAYGSSGVRRTRVPMPQST